MMKALFVLPSLDERVGRNFTHISLWRREVGHAVVAAFTRGENSVGEVQADVILGRLSHGDILSRIPTYRAALSKLTELVKQVDVVFVYTLDTFVFAWMAKIAGNSDARLVFFLMDIREKFIGDSIFNQITQSFLLFAMERCDLILVTSNLYVEDYCKRYLSRTPRLWMEVENKVDSAEVTRDGGISPVRDSPEEIVIGYFGALRCRRSIEILSRLASSNSGRFRIYVRGVFLGEELGEKEFIALDRVDYGGPYQNPEDLELLYCSCDLIWICYPYSREQDGNYRWAKTNRFYEAGFFQRPVIASEGTQDGAYVANHGLGVLVDLASPDETVRSLEALTRGGLERFSDAYRAVPETRFEYGDEFAEVANLLRRQPVPKKN